MRAGREQLRGQDRREPDRAGADDRDRVAGLRRRRSARRPRTRSGGCRRGRAPARRSARPGLVDGGVRERHPRVLGLEAVDQVAEDPAAAAGAEAVAALLAEAAAAARGDARDEHAVARPRASSRASPISTTVPTASWPRIVPGCTSGTSPLRMCRSVPQIVDESIRTIASVGYLDRRIGHLVPGPLAGPVVDESFHGSSFRLAPTLAARRPGRHRRPPRTGCGFPAAARSIASTGTARQRLGSRSSTHEAECSLPRRLPRTAATRSSRPLEPRRGRRVPTLVVVYVRHEPPPMLGETLLPALRDGRVATSPVSRARCALA